MITAIQCACMHSRLTEEQVRENFGWVLRALNEYGSRSVYQYIEANYIIEPAPQKPFIVANVREIFEQMSSDSEDGISFTRGVELFNEVAAKYYLRDRHTPSVSAEEVLAKHEWLPGGGWTKKGIIAAMHDFASRKPAGEGYSREQIKKAWLAFRVRKIEHNTDNYGNETFDEFIKSLK